MKTFRLITGSLFVMTILAMTALAQAQAQPPAKIALVNTDAFYAETGGITKITNAYKILDAEFARDFTELENMIKQLEALQAEVETLQRAANPNRQAIQAKVDQGEKLQREYNFKKEDTQERYKKRESALIVPIIQEVGKAIETFAKQKGYTLVLDSGRLFQAQVLIYLEETTDVTEAFIQFYNTSPGGTATAKP